MGGSRVDRAVSNPSGRASNTCGPTTGCTAGARCPRGVALAWVIAGTPGGRHTGGAVPEEAGGHSQPLKHSPPDPAPPSPPVEPLGGQAEAQSDHSWSPGHRRSARTGGGCEAQEPPSSRQTPLD